MTHYTDVFLKKINICIKIFCNFARFLVLSCNALGGAVLWKGL